MKLIKLLISIRNQLISRFLGQAINHFLLDFSVSFLLSFIFLQLRST